MPLIDTEGIARALARLSAAYVGEVRRLLSPPPPPAAEPSRPEINCTSASTQQAWHPHHRAPAAARATGFTIPRAGQGDGEPR